ncbi:MAG: 30S ribosomal protein S13 [Proteobacteria bacterium]|jgi:small subunit ribosomal protein S13|nr:30S ribosomal protein S13 [Pseudomonadota bacterium]
MARIAGVDLPRNKNLNIALTYIHGVGKKTSEKIIETLKLSPTLKTDQMDEAIVAKIRDYLERNLAVEGELRRRNAMNIKRLIDLQTYRGLRHRKGLPVRGQRTRSNARTRKGPRKTVAGKASVKTLK